MSSQRDRMLAMLKQHGFMPQLEQAIKDSMEAGRAAKIPIFCDSCHHVFQGEPQIAMAAHRFCSDRCRAAGPMAPPEERTQEAQQPNRKGRS